MPHLVQLRAPAQALSAFRSTSSSLPRAPLNKRFFTPSAYNMAIKAYFDVAWEGPEVEVDKSGNITKKGAAKRELAIASRARIHCVRVVDLRGLSLIEVSSRTEWTHQLRAL
jgi:hypothetical protein